MTAEKHTPDGDLFGGSALVDGNLVYGLNPEGFNAWTAQVWDEGGIRHSRALELARRWNIFPTMLAALRYAQGEACGGCGACEICNAIEQAEGGQS